MSKTNPLGSVIKDSVADVWNGPGYAGLRRSIEIDIDSVPICRGCPMRTSLAPPQEFWSNVPLPRSLVIETVGGCNLECPGCDRASIEGGRKKLAMSWDDYTKIVDQLSPNLRYLEFYVAGENWAHHRAADMVKYCRDKNPRCLMHTSTNAHYFETDAKARAAVESGIDLICCSIDGTTQDVYERGKTRGNLQKAVDGMKRLVRIKNELGRRRPVVVWRYILFHWNSSPAQMDEARRMAAEIGVDHLVWHLNADKVEYNPERYFVGSPHLSEIEHELWDTLHVRSSKLHELAMELWGEIPADPLEIGTYPRPNANR